MPQAEVSTDTQRYDLKSAPPDGFIVVKKFSYGEKLKIRSLTARIHIAAREMAQRREESRKTGKDDIGFEEIEMSFDMEVVKAFEFKRGIVEHNLTKKDGTPFNFSNRADFLRLDEKIGEEIEEHIEDFNPDIQEAKEPGPDGSPLASESGKPSPVESSPTTTPS